MRLVTFLPAGADAPLSGELRGEELVAFEPGTTVLDLLTTGDRTPASGAVHALADVELLAPVQRPAAIFAIGLNYAEHAREQGKELPEVPMVFAKTPRSSVAGDGEAHVPVAATRRLDYEVELAIVIGAGGEIAGYAVADDLSARDLQRSEPRWTRAKGFDHSCPWGPWVTTADEVPDPERLAIRSWVNGEPRQDGTTSELIFGPQALVDFITETCTLEPGDLILTGTPSGVGNAMSPPRYLADGDVVRCEIEGLGAIEHTIRFRP
jgi:acylpyruvate hydrolase